MIARRTSPNPPIAIRLAVGTIWNGADLAVNPRDWQRGRYDWRVLADLFVTIIAGEWSDSLLDIVDEVAEYAGALFIEVAGRRYEAAELAASCARVGILSGLELGEVLPPSWWRADAIYARRVRGWVEMMERHHHAKP